ncbi:MAG: AAA family ATPase, partial [Chloroflexi bacterium]|nr:AAA family ATPase [Chloroflexota bacterium]
GSGLTQFILVLVNAAVQQPSFVLIDEPELNLHPSLQLDFLTTLTSYSSHGILFATHSLGFARASADSIYSVRIIDEGESEVSPLEATPRLSEFLGELSFSEYQELGFNRVLLVEGATDVKTVQQFLRRNRKDHEVVLLPLGGSQLINKSAEAQLHEIKRISGKVAALIDSEREAPDAKLARRIEGFMEASKNAGVRCHVLERRAIENYFTDAAVRRVKGGNYKALEPYQALRDAELGWAKSENWRIAREMSLDDLEGTDLGKFLNSL